MKKILLLLVVVLLSGCPRRIVKVNAPSKCAPTPPVMGCEKLRVAYKKVAGSCSKGLQICQTQIKKWQRQCAASDAELDAIENGKK